MKPPMTYKEYLEWYKQHTGGCKPPLYLLQKHYPDEYREEDAIEETPRNIYFVPPKVDFLLGGEGEG